MEEAGGGTEIMKPFPVSLKKLGISSESSIQRKSAKLHCSNFYPFKPYD
jgi:hypothetical protein